MSEVVISAPDQREGEKEIDEETDDVVLTFWRRMMERHGGEEAYNKNIIKAFKFGPAIRISSSSWTSCYGFRRAAKHRPVSRQAAA